MLRSAVVENAVSVSPSTQKTACLNSSERADGASAVDVNPDDSATYLFELLVAARRLAVTRRHKFLAYLIGMAAEEARLLSQGRSAVRQ